jgi:hypothetical protein
MSASLFTAERLDVWAAETQDTEMPTVSLISRVITDTLTRVWWTFKEETDGNES